MASVNLYPDLSPQIAQQLIQGKSTENGSENVSIGRQSADTADKSTPSDEFITGRSTQADKDASVYSLQQALGANDVRPGAVAAEPVEDDEKELPAEKAEEGKGTPPQTNELTEDEKKQVQDLKARDAEVRAHERAHSQAGGQYVRGGASYTYQTGPDGKRYAIGGEVSIDTSEVPDDPEATIRKAQTVRRAALAPAQPSTQDQRVAAQAGQMENEARADLRAEQAEEQQERIEEAKNTDNSGAVGAPDESDDSDTQTERPAQPTQPTQPQPTNPIDQPPLINLFV